MPAADIRVKNLHKSFGPTPAVRGVSFDIRPGELVGFLGPNGAGKSTTMRILAGRFPPSKGCASVNGHDSIRDSTQCRRSLGYLPESNPLHPEMRVRSYLGFRAGLYGLRGRARRQAVDRAVERCWLADSREKRIGTLSKGYRQRVGLAAALLHDPPALLLDEPTGGLDPSQILETRRLLRELSGEHTILLSSHILPEVERTCQRVIVIARGRVRADGSPAALARAAGGAAAVIVEWRDGRDVAAALGRIPRVGRVEEIGGAPQEWRRARIVAGHAGADLREPIARVCAEAGALVRELTIERGEATLERAFARLIEAEDEEAPR